MKLKAKNWKGMLLDNWLLKLASLLVAASLWFVVIIENDPVEEHTVRNVRVNLLNTQQLTERGMVYEVLDNTAVIRSVTFEAPRSIGSDIIAEDIVAEADFNKVTDIDTVEIRFSCPKYSVDVKNIRGSNNTLKLDIEKLDKDLFLIEKNITGEVAKGYMINDVTISSNRLNVEGPESKMKQVFKAMVDVDVEALKGFASTVAQVYLVDKKGSRVEYDSLVQSVRNVTYEVEVYKIKEVPVKYTVTGEPAEGYLATGVVEGIPASVRIAGEEERIAGISELMITDPLDITGMEGNLELNINLKKYLNSGIIFADKNYDGKEEAVVYVEQEAEKEVRVRRNNIEILNIPEGVLAEVVLDQEIPALQVKGLNADLEELRDTTLKGTIDVAEWMAENPEAILENIVHELPVKFELQEGQEPVNDVYVQVLFSNIQTTTVES